MGKYLQERNIMRKFEKIKNIYMEKHIKFPKIQQFRNAVSDIKRQVSFVKTDLNGDAVYDPSAKMPVITFSGSVKLHGTNASVCYNHEDGFWAQSRNNIITPESDNAGFAKFAYDNEGVFMRLFNKVFMENTITSNTDTVTIFGEWAGKGIQKGVGISGIDKSFFIFGIRVTTNDEQSYWIDHTGVSAEEYRIYNMLDFKTYSIDIDFNMPQLVQNTLAEHTEKVENECPIASELGISNGTGEGVVWTGMYDGTVYRFKVKGKKHSVTKVKTLASVDTEKLRSVQEFVEYSVTRARFDQAITEVFGNASDIDIKKMGDFLRWIINDITSEEMDTMTDNNLVPKDVNKYISQKSREMFLEAYNSIPM